MLTYWEYPPCGQECCPHRLWWSPRCTRPAVWSLKSFPKSVPLPSPGPRLYWGFSWWHTLKQCIWAETIIHFHSFSCHYHYHGSTTRIFCSWTVWQFKGNVAKPKGPAHCYHPLRIRLFHCPLLFWTARGQRESVCCTSLQDQGSLCFVLTPTEAPADPEAVSPSHFYTLIHHIYNLLSSHQVVRKVREDHGPSKRRRLRQSHRGENLDKTYSRV